MIPTIIYIKDTNAIVDYQFDWLDWLGTDTINTSTLTVASGLTLGNGSNGAPAPSNTTTKATYWLLGGLVGNDYLVTNRIVTAGGRTAERSVLIRVRET